MKTLTKELWMNVPQRRAIVSIHRDVEKLVAESRRSGRARAHQRHAHHRERVHQRQRAGLAPRLRQMARRAGSLRSSPERYHHNRTGEDNADAHHKRQIMGREVVVAITEGKLHLGPWEHIFYYEFDGRRKKRVLVKIIGE